jgi:hypothetical protein
MKTLFAMLVAVALESCGPLDENETVTGQAVQAVVNLPERVDVTTGQVKKDSPRSAQEALYAPDRPTFVGTHLYDTGIERTVPAMPTSSPR